jgi:RsiW-degrading membrane proteinase PrsW (M82 family)
VNVLYVTLLVIATFIWGFVFYKKDYHPQPFKVLAQIFVAGIASMIPIFAYKSIYQNFLPELAEYEIFKPLLDSFILRGAFFFLINLAILSVILIVICSVISLILTFFKHETLINIRDSLKNDELGFVSVSMMVGFLVYMESFAEKIFNIPIVTSLIGAILFLTVIEEYIKHLIVRFVDDKKLKDIDDAITLSIMVGLAFAFAETIIYAISTGDMSLVIYRSFMSMPVHVVSSGIFGYYYGLAHFAKPLIKANGGEKTYKLNLTWIHKIIMLKKSAVYEEVKFMEGIGLATLFHALCNILFEIHVAFAVVPILVIGLFAVSRLYKKSHVLYRFLHT